MVRAILTGALEEVTWDQDPIFGFQVPESCPEVPPGVLQPRNTWNDPGRYDAQARELAGLFAKNFQKFAKDVSEEVKAAAPI
jgi:phosphoenolpyruvate carboxykinase (ATP)